jgi:protein-tyrosine kinase
MAAEENASMSSQTLCAVPQVISPCGRDRSLGAILVDSGRLAPEAVERVLRAQKEQGLRFGDAAISLGLVSDEDIQFAFAAQFEYPYLKTGDQSVSAEVIAAFKPFTAVVEQLRALRSQLMLRWFNGEPGHRALSLVSADRGEGRSFLAANLAVVFSQLGERTLLIDADLRNPRQHELFRLGSRAGLSAILAGRAGTDAVIRITSMVDLSVLPAGLVPPNPLELLGRPQFASLLDDLAKQFDVILLDTPAGALMGDAQTIAARAGSALLVARQNASLTRSLQQLTATLGETNAAVVGSVLNAG